MLFYATPPFVPSDNRTAAKSPLAAPPKHTPLCAMELSAPPRSLPSVLHRPFVPTISPLLLVSSRRLPNKSLLASRSPKSVPGLNRSIGRPLWATASDREASTTIVADDDAPKPVVGPSMLVNSSSAEEDVPDEGGEQISGVADDLLPKLNLKVLSSPSASAEETSTTVVADDDTPTPVVGPSFLMNSSSAEEDVRDEGGEQISEAADDLLSNLNLKVLSSPSASDEETSTTVVADDDTPKPVVGPSFIMNSSSAEKDVPDEGGEQISDAADDLLSELNVKNPQVHVTSLPPHQNVDQMDLEDTHMILFYGAGTLVALLILSAIISSIDSSVPLFSKVMEVVGLGFTLWFSFRYLIFKENRDELISKLDDLKQTILGPSDN
ncbi:hypothetical protein MUK42_11541 [Musa troglodytarum]|uniref:Cyanobacterial aminoacyl-tRNA synthetase CAAD domain-containing protein n=1 Tax=Musa troglodytarum TaxID=320322 RepID=A0A9E7KKB6_9LILI|nr:hypothetical protein MUK42_11541 [Musa troglodytarum]